MSDIPATDGPWKKYQAAPEGPWSKYQQQPAPKAAPTEAPSGLEAFGTGAKQAVIDTGLGIAQGMSRLRNAIPFLPPTAPEASPQAMDKLVAQQAQDPAFLAAQRAHPYLTTGGQVAGNIAATAPLAFIPGGPLARLGLAGRLGQAGAIGTGAALTQPVQVAPGQTYAGQKAKQGLEGAAGGVAGGALGELVGSTLGNAIAGNNTAVIDRYLTGGYRQAIRPRQLAGKVVGYPQLSMQDNRIITMVDTMNDLAKAGNLELTDAAGNLLPKGSTPKNLWQFSEGVDGAARQLFRQYDLQAQNAGRGGVQIGLLPTVAELRKVAADKTLQDVSPRVATDAAQLADNFERRLFYTPSEMQDAIMHVNRLVQKDMRAQGSSILMPVVQKMRGDLDATITALEGPGYQELKNKYGALVSVRNDVAAAAQRHAKNQPWGKGFANAIEFGQIAYGLMAHSPEAFAGALATEVGKRAVRYLNDPNRAIERLFRQRANPPGALRTGLGQATLSFAPPAGALLGGQAPQAINSDRDLRVSVSQ